ncbi:MAG: M28 family metallopeptidase [Vicingaceae bacterium]
MRSLLTFFSLIFFTNCFSQDTTFARKTIDTLTSFYFCGRGALKNGEKKAASYIALQYKKNKLIPFEQTYFQKFTSPINTITGNISVRLDKRNLLIGRDYIIGAESGSLNGKFDLVYYNKENLPDLNELKSLAEESFFKNKAVVLDVKGIENNTKALELINTNKIGALCLVFITDKLTHHLSKANKNYGVIHVLRTRFKFTYKTITLNINQKLLNNYQSQNVIAYLKGTQYPDSFIVLSAHYDHLGKMGNEIYFPGANDNASGVAMLLNMAKHYAQNPPTKSIVFIAFGAEEIGLVGSKYFVEHPLIPLKQINFVFNMDLMGTGSKGGMIVNGKVFEKHYEQLVKINTKNNYLPLIKKRGKAANSDHYWFSEKGIPAFFMYLMGGVNAYHDIDDVSKTLPLTEYEDSFRLIRDFVDEL